MGTVLQGVGLALTFASSVLLARVLGPEGLGQFSYALAIVGALSTFATLGIPTVVARLLASYQSNATWGRARGLLRWSNLAISGVGLVLCLGLMAFGLFAMVGNVRWLYVLAAPLVVVIAWTNLRQRALQGLRHPLAAQLPEQFVKHSVFIAIVGVFWHGGHHSLTQPHGVMAMWLTATAVALLVGALLMARFTPPALGHATPQYSPDEWAAIALPILTADLLGMVLSNSDTILLGWLRPSDEVGVYQVALRLSGLMLIPLGASNWALAPWFSRLQAAGDIRRLQSVVTRTTRALFGLTAALYVLVVVLGEPLLNAFYGPSFVKAYPLLLTLGAAQLLNVATGPVVNLLAMTGGQRELLRGIAIAAVGHVPLCYALIAVFGMSGAACSVALSISGYNLLLAWFVRQRIGIGATVLG